jgi:hypothetical protein
MRVWLQDPTDRGFGRRASGLAHLEPPGVVTLGLTVTVRVDAGTVMVDAGMVTV